MRMSISNLTPAFEVTVTADPVAPADTVPRKPLVVPFIGYLLYFVGIGQIAGGVVHYPIDPSYFAMMALLGVFVFLAGTWLNEVVLPPVRPSAARIARLVSASVVLSIGVGGVSGGAQHFLQFPERSAVLIGAGLVIAYIGFAWKGSFSTQQTALVGVVVAALAALTFFALQPLASSIGDGGGHDHGGASDGAPQQPQQV